MNKKLYLLVLGAASLALQPVNARSQFTKKQVAKVVNTDVAISLATSSDSEHTEIIVPNIISVVKPADMPVVSFGSKKEDQLLGCDLIYNSDSLNVLPTRTFDEKGRLAYVKSPDEVMNAMFILRISKAEQLARISMSIKLQMRLARKHFFAARLMATTIL